MLNFFLGLFGAMAAVLIFGVGYALGKLSNHVAVRKWLDKNGCYMCQEKLKYQQEFDEGE